MSLSTSCHLELKKWSEILIPREVEAFIGHNFINSSSLLGVKDVMIYVIVD